MTTSTAKPCSGWKRMNALDSPNNAVPLSACSSGQSQWPTCSTIPPREKMASFSESPSPDVYHSSASVWKTQTNRTKIWLTETDLMFILWVRELLQPDEEQLQPLASLAVVAPSWAISGRHATLALPSVLDAIHFHLAVRRGVFIHSLKDRNPDLAVQLFRKQSVVMLMKATLARYRMEASGNVFIK